MQKIIKRCLFVVLIIAMVATCFSCNNKEEKAEEKQATYLFLGDSIAEALLGPSPISERDSYGYYSIVGQVNGAKYINRAISGLTSNGFVNSLCQRNYFAEDDAFYREYWIKNADVIFISMLGNDVLCNDMIDFAIETGIATTASGERTLSDDYQSKLNRRCRPNLNEGMARIYELNPNVTVIWQTLYNPFFNDSVLLGEDAWDWYYEEVEKGTIDPKYTFRDLADVLVDAMNDLVYEYKEQNPDKNFIISDVNKAFDEVFAKSEEEGQKLIFSDCIHPSVRGHALIAETLEKTLCELGLSSIEEATSKYKKVVSDRSDRLFDDQSVLTAIAAAEDFSGVSNAYFSLTENLTPNYASYVSPYENGTYYEEDTTYYLSSLQLDEMELSTIDTTALDLDESYSELLEIACPDGISVVNKKKSYLSLKSDGTFEMRFTVDNTVNDFVKLILPLIFDISDIDVVDIYKNVPFCSYNTTYEMYFSELFPGFDLADLSTSVEVLSSAGCTLTGVDTESESFNNVAQSLNETGKLPSGFLLPSGFGFKLNGYYTVETLGEGESARKVVYLRVVRTGEDTVPMFCVLIDGNNDPGSALLKIEFTSIRILFKIS